MLPVTIMVTLLIRYSKNKKIFVIITHILVIIISIIIFQFSDTVYGNVIDIDAIRILGWIYNVSV